MWISSPFASLGMVVMLASPLSAQVREVGPDARRAARAELWRGPDGEPLPFHTHAEAIDFLRTASVVSSASAPRGVTGVRKLVLEKDGVRAEAAFRTVSIEKRNERLGGRTVFFFRDHYLNEVAAYALSRTLHGDVIPPTVERSLRGKAGSLQLWFQGTFAEVERVEQKLEPPDRRSFLLQLHMMRVFDNLINNLDRNQGNILIDPGWRLWLIDHTRAFSRDRVLPSPELIRRVARPFWDRLRSISDEELQQVVTQHLPGPERAALVERRRLLVKLIEEKIELLGEEGVLFSVDG